MAFLQLASSVQRIARRGPFKLRFLCANFSFWAKNMLFLSSVLFFFLNFNWPASFVNEKWRRRERNKNCGQTIQIWGGQWLCVVINWISLFWLWPFPIYNENTHWCKFYFISFFIPKSNFKITKICVAWINVKAPWKKKSKFLLFVLTIYWQDFLSWEGECEGHGQINTYINTYTFHIFL